VVVLYNRPSIKEGRFRIPKGRKVSEECLNIGSSHFLLQRLESLDSQAQNMARTNDKIRQGPQHDTTHEAAGPLSRTAAEGNLVEWDGPEDARNPINWPGGKRWAHIILVAVLAFVA
jgi:hypothetical protein